MVATKSCLVPLLPVRNGVPVKSVLPFGLIETNPLCWNIFLLIFILSCSRLANLRFDEVITAGSGIIYPTKEVLLQSRIVAGSPLTFYPVCFIQQEVCFGSFLLQQQIASASPLRNAYLQSLVMIICGPSYLKPVRRFGVMLRCFDPILLSRLSKYPLMRRSLIDQSTF